jgi:hypothetical protein
VYAVSGASESKFISTDSNLAKVLLFTDKPKTTPLYKVMISFVAKLFLICCFCRVCLLNSASMLNSER